MQASTRPRPHPARADTAHTPMNATRNRPTGPAHAAAPAAGIPDVVGLKGVSGPATGIDRLCTESSAGARGASDEGRGSSSSIVEVARAGGRAQIFLPHSAHTSCRNKRLQLARTLNRPACSRAGGRTRRRTCRRGTHSGKWDRQRQPRPWRSSDGRHDNGLHRANDCSRAAHRPAVVPRSVSRPSHMGPR